MAAGSYFTTASPVALAGLVVQSETRVRVGLMRLYTGALETTSALYISYGGPVGVVAGNSFDLGEVESLSFEHVPNFEQPDVANVLQSSLEVLSEEETTISIGVRQFDPRMIELLVRTGTMYNVGSGANERYIQVGGKCASGNRRPIELCATNIGCNAPASPGDTETQIAAIIITAYDCAATSGFNWGDMVANDLNVLDTEWTVYPVTAHSSGNKLFSVYIF